ncbi:AlpA family phage regulatory protein [Escherichia coli]|uniref:helix-turn-helix transcriptional regulator n=1 Tax=Escherichia coli TaxID=562 RepID=UPI000DDE0AEC|nr:AlpA family phage regulatory protein [Escherichia coli]EHC2234586.1 AlpA family phage regulatory protein [Escherichia coli]EHX1581620.1 AlpA family phage regulatory protein [Escherichia coli]
MKIAIRKNVLLQMVPLSESTIYALEQKGLFPKRFALTKRAVAWDKEEVECWLKARQENNYHPTDNAVQKNLAKAPKRSGTKIPA